MFYEFSAGVYLLFTLANLNNVMYMVYMVHSFEVYVSKLMARYYIICLLSSMCAFILDAVDATLCIVSYCIVLYFYCIIYINVLQLLQNAGRAHRMVHKS